jgi:glycosyl hydrolase family 106( putative alpha-L-rhamnosidase)
MRKIIILLSLLFTTAISIAQLSWPSINSTTKPWTRWWWIGSAVNKKDLSWNLEQYQKAGLGGVEITPIYGVHGYENQFINFLSPQWMQMLVHTLNESKRLGLGVDLANATGWPFGGPWVTDKDASKTIYYKNYTLNSGEQLKELIEYRREAMVRTANNKPAGIDSILNPLSRNKNLQSLALDQIQFPGKLPLIALVAYNEKGFNKDLIKLVDSNGKLSWTALPGKWTIYALFEGLHGKMVERAAPGGEGYAIDHFSATAAKNYFARFDRAFQGYNLSYLRGFFNDSYEVDDARGQANWTTGFFNEFQKRKGYDLREWLPALFGKMDSNANISVTYDYRSVIDELILDNFTKEWKKWGASKGKLLRNQSHGSPANTLDLYSVVDIPETEGTDILRFKFASSAGNVSGKQLVSAESATWLDEHFLSSLSDVKKAIDLYFLGGINHIVYHGTAYSPKDAPWPGWLFYAAVHFQPTNPEWKDFPALNTYITRVQSFLQKAKPDNDILLYYPIMDRYSQPGNALLQHFDGMERNFENTEFEHLSKWMLEKGYSFDFISDRRLAGITSAGNKLNSKGSNYRAILLPANRFMSETSLSNLIKLAEQGATILIYKNLPKSVPGLASFGTRIEKFLSLIAKIHFSQEGKIRKAVMGKGAFYISDDAELLMQAAKARKETASEKGLSVLRRSNADGTVYFFNNRTEKTFEDWVELSGDAASIALFNAMTGRNGLARRRKNSTGKDEVWLQLKPDESIIVQSYAVKKTGNNYSYTETGGQPIQIKGQWNITFIEGGPTMPSTISTTALKSWTELGSNDLKNFSGTAKYSISFEKPLGNASSFLLDLGKVDESAEVILNGKKIATLIGSSYQCVIPVNALLPSNKLDILVSNLMANRIVHMDKNQIPWKIFYNTNMPARKRENVKNGLFDASDWKPLPSGLLGPVTITPLK